MTDLVAARNKLIEVRTDLDSAINKLAQQIEAQVVVTPAPGNAVPVLNPDLPPPAGFPWGVERPIPWGAKVSREFRQSVFWIEKELKLPADFLMSCMAFETGVTFSPSKRNPASSATGLIQFMSATARNLGTTTSALAQMSAVRQLGYVYHYFKGFGSDHSDWNLADCYMAILLPVMIGRPLDAPMAWSESAEAVNRGLDTNRDGTVTKREAYKKVLDMFRLGSQPENKA